MKKIKPRCFVGSEYLKKCPACQGDIKILQEGSLKNSGSDIVECDCTHWELPNSLELMGNKLTFGSFKETRKK